MIILEQNRLWRMEADADTPSAWSEDWGEPVHVALGDSSVVVATANGVLLAAGEPSQDIRRIQTGIADPITSVLVLRDNPLALLVGTESPRLYRVENGQCEPVASFDNLACRPQWHTPWGGPAALRSLARGGTGCIYADIHVGSIMRSPDEGRTWEPVTPDLNEDVHQVATCPAHPDRVYANTAHAVYLSDDRGTTWRYCGEALGGRYGRAVAPHPADPDRFLASVSDGPHGTDVRGQLFLTTDAGRSWKHVTAGFPQSTRANIDTFHIAFTRDGTAWAAVDRCLFRSRDGGDNWREVWTAPGALDMLATR